MKKYFTFLITMLLYTIVTGFDILHLNDHQSMLVIYYDNLPTDELLIDNYLLKNKASIIQTVEEILKQRNAY